MSRYSYVNVRNCLSKLCVFVKIRSCGYCYAYFIFNFAYKQQICPIVIDHSLIEKQCESYIFINILKKGNLI